MITTHTSILEPSSSTEFANTNSDLTGNVAAVLSSSSGTTITVRTSRATRTAGSVISFMLLLLQSVRTTCSFGSQPPFVDFVPTQRVAPNLCLSVGDFSFSDDFFKLFRVASASFLLHLSLPQNFVICYPSQM